MTVHLGGVHRGIALRGGEIEGILVLYAVLAANEEVEDGKDNDNDDLNDGQDLFQPVVHGNSPPCKRSPLSPQFDDAVPEDGGVLEFQSLGSFFHLLLQLGDGGLLLLFG